MSKDQIRTVSPTFANNLAMLEQEAGTFWNRMK
jgi:hypothetical protein